MKIRNGFVSNSSSSSFIINKNNLTADEEKLILDYIDSEANDDGWSIEIDETSGLINGWTSMDNGAFETFCHDYRLNKVKFI